MKKIYLLLLAALFAVNLSAQQSEEDPTMLLFWRGGKVLKSFPIYPNDSITFLLPGDTTSTGGGGGDTTYTASSFNYYNWRE